MIAIRSLFLKLAPLPSISNRAPFQQSTSKSRCWIQMLTVRLVWLRSRYVYMENWIGDLRCLALIWMAAVMLMKTLLSQTIEIWRKNRSIGAPIMIWAKHHFLIQREWTWWKTERIDMATRAMLASFTQVISPHSKSLKSWRTALELKKLQTLLATNTLVAGIDRSINNKLCEKMKILLSRFNTTRKGRWNRQLQSSGVLKNCSVEIIARVLLHGWAKSRSKFRKISWLRSLVSQNFALKCANVLMNLTRNLPARAKLISSKQTCHFLEARKRIKISDLYFLPFFAHFTTRVDQSLLPYVYNEFLVQKKKFPSQKIKLFVFNRCAIKNGSRRIILRRNKWRTMYVMQSKTLL